MPRHLEQVLAKLPAKRRAKVQQRAAELATLKDLRHAVEQTQEELATALGVGQDTISRLEQRSDMLLSTLKRYVEAMGGKLDLVATFPNRPPMIIEQIAERRGQQKRSAKGPRIGKRNAAEVERLVQRVTRHARNLGVALDDETVDLCQAAMEGRRRSRG